MVIILPGINLYVCLSVHGHNHFQTINCAPHQLPASRMIPVDLWVKPSKVKVTMPQNNETVSRPQHAFFIFYLHENLIMDLIMGSKSQWIDFPTSRMILSAFGIKRS